VTAFSAPTASAEYSGSVRYKDKMIYRKQISTFLRAIAFVNIRLFGTNFIADFVPALDCPYFAVCRHEAQYLGESTEIRSVNMTGGRVDYDAA
jgi:hypothetical protein